jgi:allantoin racemase
MPAYSAGQRQGRVRRALKLMTTPKLRILVVNPNTDAAATEIIRAQAVTVASADVEIVATTASRGPAVIVTPADSAAQGPVTIEAIQAHAASIDGAVIAAFSDPGLEVARKRFVFPVVGIGEASMKEGARIGRFVIVSANPSNESLYWAAARRHGVADRLVNIRFFERGSLACCGPDDRFAPADRPTLRTAVMEACAQAVSADHADAIVVAGGPFAGVAVAIQTAVPIPVLDGVTAAVRRADRLARTRRVDPTSYQ